MGGGDASFTLMGHGVAHSVGFFLTGCFCCAFSGPVGMGMEEKRKRGGEQAV